ncbi:MAG: hypothetical protein IPG24_11230 [Leptospiraceae bacterium]|nr:hypothetical protein [Leptospiraceae bacterium]
MIFLSAIFISLLLVLFSTYELYKSIADTIIAVIGITASLIGIYDFLFWRKK